MQVNRATFFVLNLLVLVAVIAIVAIAGWYFLSHNVDTSGVEQRAQFERLSASAQLYYNRLGFYDGVCADVGLGANLRCSDSNSAYAIETTLSAGRFYCLDSTGFMGTTLISKGSGTVCRQ